MMMLSYTVVTRVLSNTDYKPDYIPQGITVAGFNIIGAGYDFLVKDKGHHRVNSMDKDRMNKAGTGLS